MEQITTAITNATTAFSGIWDLLVDNPLCLCLVGFSVLAVGIGLFSRLKNAAAN